MARVEYSMYLNQLLQTDYDREFGGPSAVLYTLSTLTPCDHIFCNEKPVFSYIGNLTFNRPQALMEVADVLQSVSPSYHLDVYGKTLNQDTEVKLRDHPGISYKGFVKYDEVQKVIHNSDVLFHAETQDRRWEESLRYGFSTKIADSVSSGTCFVLYAPAHIACSRYIKETGAGWFADNKEDLKKVLEELLFNEEKRKAVLNKAQSVAATNHSLSNNCKKFREIICECVKNK